MCCAWDVALHPQKNAFAMSWIVSYVWPSADSLPFLTSLYRILQVARPTGGGCSHRVYSQCLDDLPNGGQESLGIPDLGNVGFVRQECKGAWCDEPTLAVNDFVRGGSQICTNSRVHNMGEILHFPPRQRVQLSPELRSAMWPSGHLICLSWLSSLRKCRQFGNQLWCLFL